jgi:hypothetical protein
MGAELPGHHLPVPFKGWALVKGSQRYNLKNHFSESGWQQAPAHHGGDPCEVH